VREEEMSLRLAEAVRLSAPGPGTGRQSHLQVAFGVFLSAPATWEVDGTVSFGPADAIPGALGGRTAHATSTAGNNHHPFARMF
jgi:hypothetical protein